MGLCTLAVAALASLSGSQETEVSRPTGVALPELPVAEWGRNGTVALEDFRGQLTAIVFYDDKTG